MNALRRIAALASDYVELCPTEDDEPGEGRAELRELREALDDLRRRFPYTLDAEPSHRLELLLR